jgi:hypothetical protein
MWLCREGSKLGMTIDVGLIVNGLAAIGSFAAAGAAVWVATSDRRERIRERDAEDAAQARMVIVSPQRSDHPLELQITVTNLSPRVIVDVTFVQLTAEDHDFGDLQPVMGPFPVVAPPAAAVPRGGSLAGKSLFTFSPEAYGREHPYFVAVRGGPNGEPMTITSKTRLGATIRWTDASGKIWERMGFALADGSGAELRQPTPIRAR